MHLLHSVYPADYCCTICLPMVLRVLLATAMLSLFSFYSSLLSRILLMLLGYFLGTASAGDYSGVTRGVYGCLE